MTGKENRQRKRNDTKWQPKENWNKLLNSDVVMSMQIIIIHTNVHNIYKCI